MFKITECIFLSWTLLALVAMVSPASMEAESAGLTYRTGKEVALGVRATDCRGLPSKVALWRQANGASSTRSLGFCVPPTARCKAADSRNGHLRFFPPSRHRPRRKDDLVCTFDYRFRERR